MMTAATTSGSIGSSSSPWRVAMTMVSGAVVLGTPTKREKRVCKLKERAKEGAQSKRLALVAAPAPVLLLGMHF